MKKQEFTSANTSINRSKLPSVYSKLDYLVHVYGGHGTIVDYGCGKFTDHLKQRANDLGLEWYGFDPFNQPEEVNDDGLKHMVNADWIVSANVLNVIKEDEIVQDIVNVICSNGKRVAVAVYEGDRSGTGKPSMAGCYQRNERLHDYLRFFPSAAHIENGMIIYNPTVQTMKTLNGSKIEKMTMPDSMSMHQNHGVKHG